MFKISFAYLSASFSELCAEWDSCHKNSFPLSNGILGLKDSHLITEQYWLTNKGKSFSSLIHFANDSYIIASEVGLITYSSFNLFEPTFETTKTSRKKSSKCFCCFLKDFTGIKVGK